MRVVKEANERRNEILDIAVKLFASKGYEETSVSDIMNEVGIAKGTLYYHFKSKEEILNGIIERMQSVVLLNARTVANNPKLSVHDKVLQTLLALKIKESGSEEIFMEVHKPQNALMHQKMLNMMIANITPILAQIVEEGNKKGVFNCKYPYESSELFIVYGNIIFDDGYIVLSNEEMMSRMLAFIGNMERVLGTKEGEMQYVLQMFQ